MIIVNTNKLSTINDIIAGIWKNSNENHRLKWTLLALILLTITHETKEQSFNNNVNNNNVNNFNVLTAIF